MHTPSTTKRDVQLQQDVIAELAWDTRLDPASVGVLVADGIVTLTGTADCWAKKHAAEQAAHRVAGVLDVANEIAVRPSWSLGKTDAEIAAEVRHALTADALVPADRIRSTVEGGLVTLAGVVELGTQREDAVRAIQHLAGVRGVSNEIVVEPPGDLGPDTIRESIARAIERHANRAAHKVQISVEAGHITLTGTVASAAERRAIVGAATATRGVQRVVDHLQVG